MDGAKMIRAGGLGSVAAGGIRKAVRHRLLHVGALGAPDGLEALEGFALVLKPEE
jgi:hypothetical protein